MPKFRKRPVVIDAWQWLGNVYEPWLDNKPFVLDNKPFVVDASNGKLEIPTLEGTLTASVGDWIIRGVKGEFYPCKADIFALTYEEVPSDV